MGRSRGRGVARRGIAIVVALAASGVSTVAVQAARPAVADASVQIASTTRVSLRDSGAQLSTGPTIAPSGATIDVVASGDGRFVGFSSKMDDVVPDKANGNCNDDSSTHWGVYDAYVRDTVLGRTSRVSLTSDGGELKCPLRVSGFSAGMESRIADISFDGRFVLFLSNSVTLGIPPRDPGGNSFNTNVFIRDRDTDGNGTFDEEGGTATVPVSVSAVFDQLGAAMQARGGGGSPADSPGMHNVHADLSNDGRFVTFTADWSVLSGGSQSYRQDIVVYDRDVDGNGVFDEPGTTNLALVSASSADVRGNANSYYPVVSDGGRFVTFLSVATNLVSGVADGRRHLYTRDRDTDADGVLDEPGAVATTLQDQTAAGSPANDSAESHVDMSFDGRYVVFASPATDLAGGDSEFCVSCRSTDVFLRDRDVDEDGVFDEPGIGATSTTLVSDSSNPNVRIGDNPAISADGQWVSFRGWVQKPSGPIVQSVVVRDPAGALTVVSVHQTTGAAEDGAGANRAAMSRNGNFIAFETFSANLVSGDTNGRNDIFQTNIVQGVPQSITVSMTPDAWLTGPGASEVPLASISTDRLRTLRPDLVNAAGRYKTSGMQRHAGSGVRRTSGTGQRKYSGSGQRKTSGGYPPNLLDAPLNRVAGRLAGVTSVRAIALSDIPVLVAPLGTTKDSWEELLVGTSLAGRPTNSITFGQVLDLLVGTALSSTHDLRKVGIGAISRDGSPLAAASVAGLQLGATPVQPLVYGDGQTWCTKFNQLAAGATNCAALGVTATSGTTMLELDFNPVAAGILDDNPTLRRPPIAANLTRLRSASAPILSAYLADLGMRVARIGNLTLDAALGASAALRATPLPSIATLRGDLDGLVTCDIASFDCSASGATLGTARTAGSLQPDAHLKDLTYFLDGSDATLDEIASLLPADVDINDLSVATLEAADFPWEDIDVESAGLVDFAASGSPLIHYSVNVRVNDGVGPFEARVVAELPARTRYAAGSATLPGAAPIVDPVVEYLADRTRLTWLVRGIDPSTDYSLEFDARPGIRLGTFTGNGAQVRIGQVTGASDPIEYTVSDASDAGGTRVTATEAVTDSLRLGYIGDRTDVDLYTFNPPTAQSVVSVRLSHLAGDGDLVLYGPPKPSGVVDRTVAQAPIVDSTADGSATVEQVAPEPTDDVPLIGDATPLAIASSRGSATEAAQVISPRLIQVSSYDGITSEKPYVLRVRVDAQPVAPACPAYSRSGGATGTPPDLTALRSDLHTIILWNQRRMGDRYGQTAANALRAKLETFAARSEVRGELLPLDALLADQYAAWDANPCDPELANEVVRGAQHLIAEAAQRRPAFWSDAEIVDGQTVAYSGGKVIVVGGDDMVPMGRLLDPTTTANESSYASRFGDGPMGESLDLGYMRTDDPYAGWNNNDPFNPAWASDVPFDQYSSVGRLVETPTEIGSAIDTYVANDGTLDPSQAYAAGYDFMADGAGALRDALTTALTNAGGASPTVSSALSNSWTRSNLLAALAAGPDVAGVYGHFEYDAGLSASGWSTGSGETFSPGDLASSLGIGARLVLSMGCHSGLSVPDAADVAGSGTPTGDFAQSLQGVGAVYVAASGFGYGTDGSVGLHERLLQLLAERLDGSMRVGDALTRAKAFYWLGAGLYGGYDLKAIVTTTFYGIPHYRVGPTWREPTHTYDFVETTIDPKTGLRAADFSTGTLDFARTDSTNGSYFSVQAAGGAAVDPLVLRGRPTQPRLDLDVTADPSVGSAHGVLVTRISNRAAGGGYDPATGFDGLFGAPTLNGAAVVEPVAQDVAFPARAATIASATVPGSDGAGAAPTPRQHVVLVPGSFEDDGTDDAAGTGVQRLYDSMGTRVYYSSSSDVTAPFITDVVGEVSGSTISVSGEASDASGVERVLALVDPGTAGAAWRRVELHLEAGRWVGSASLPEGAVGPRFIVQAVDGAGNVAVSSAKGRRYAAASAAGRPSAPASVSADGAYLQITVAWGEPGDPGAASITGYAIWSGTASGELSHIATVGASARSFVHDGIGGTRRYAVQALTAGGPGELSDEVVATARTDATAPTVDVVTPVDGALIARGREVFADYSCQDEPGGSGIASCVGTVADGAALDTSGLGPRSFDITATDGAGNSTVRTVSYRVVPVMAVSSAQHVEGDSGKSILHVHVSLSEPSTDTITARYRTEVGSAGSADFVAVPERMLTFRPGQVTKTVSIRVTPDTAAESDEDFSLSLAAITNAVADSGGNVQTILDDEGGSPARVGIDDLTFVEGRSKARPIHVMVSLAAPATAAISVPYTTVAGTATGTASSRVPGDFRLRTGTIAFAVGQQVKVIAIQTLPDGVAEADETLTIVLGGTAEIARSVGTVTILDDD